MTRRMRRPAPKQDVQLTPPSPPVADPVPGPSNPPMEVVIAPDPPADPHVVWVDRAMHGPVGPTGGGAAVAARQNLPAPEKTLHELNLEARAIDREHARRCEEARAKAREVIEPMLLGVMRPRRLARPVQKNLRPPVNE